MRSITFDYRPSASFIILTILALAILFLNPAPSAMAEASHSSLFPLANGHYQQVQLNGSSVASSLDDDLNKGDAEAALSLFNDSSTVYDLSNIACIPGPPPLCSEYNGQIIFKQKVQIDGWLEQLVKENITVREVGGFNLTDDNVNWTLEVTVNEYRRLDVAPLLANVQAEVHDSKIDALTIRLTSESLAKLSIAYSNSEQTPFSVMATGLSVGVLGLGLVFPVTAIYYISKVKRLFATVPKLDKPWVLLATGVGLLFVSLLLEALQNIAGLSSNVFEFAFTALLSICAFCIMSSMVLMKRAMIGESDE